MRQKFAAHLEATIGFDFWREQLEPLFRDTLAKRWYRLTQIGDRYAIKLASGHVIAFRIDIDHDEIIPLAVHPGG